MSRMLRLLPATCLTCSLVFGNIFVGLTLAQNSGRTKPKRPQTRQLRVQPLPLRLEEILTEWSASSAKVRTANGVHSRFVYDTVFNVEKRSTGVFYYEAPDRGRIDIEPAKIKKDDVSRRKDPKTGERFKLQADRPEKWVCNGKHIMQINEVEKQAQSFPIPAERQGQNIMDGPLPFLFGMPPSHAKQRFHLKLLRENSTQVWLEARPRWQQDAANYQLAKIILDKRQYFPVAVQLLDPSGNLETVYTFSQIKINQPRSRFFSSDPFKPNLRGYAVKIMKTKVPVPSVLGRSAKDAKENLTKLGFEVKWVRGKPASVSRLSYFVYEQEPKPNTPLEQGQPITLTVYDKLGSRTTAKP